MIKSLLEDDGEELNEKRGISAGRQVAETGFGLGLNEPIGSPEFNSPVGSDAEAAGEEDEIIFYRPPSETESMGETVRNSGLAYAAALTLFASIVFMLLLGWFADLLLGTSPWGAVAGVLLGSVIGFIQFFRITSQIFKK